MLAFNYGSSNRKAAYVIDGKEYLVQPTPASAQIVRVTAVAIVFQLLVNNSFNSYTHNHCVF